MDSNLFKDTIPESVEEIITDYHNKITSVLNKKIIGIYLHGSLVTGEFNSKAMLDINSVMRRIDIEGYLI